LDLEWNWNWIWIGLDFNWSLSSHWIEKHLNWIQIISLKWVGFELDQKTIQCPLSNVNVMHLGVHLVTWGSLLLERVTNPTNEFLVATWLTLGSSWFHNLRLLCNQQQVIVIFGVLSILELRCFKIWPHVFQSSKKHFQ
jgi:hypothetical protein